MKAETKIESKNLTVNTDLQWRYLARCSSQQARDLICLNLALKYLILPLTVIDFGDEKSITLVANRELDFYSIEELKFITGCRINYEIIASPVLSKAIHAAYKGEDRSLTTLIDKSNLEVAPQIKILEQNPQAAIPNLLDAILNRAEILSASDLHLEPISEGFRIRYRVGGQLIEDNIAKLERSVGQNLIRCIKVKAHLENLLGACDGKFYADGISATREIRVSVLPLSRDDKVVLRFFGNELLTSAGDDCLGKLGLSLAQKKMLIAALSLDSGAIVVAGPTGSGKSTLLYCCLQQMDIAKSNIVTIEDPVEHQIEGLTQVDLSRTLGLEYSQILPYVLRQDPDVLMLGEIRDSITASLAFEAALTGRMILTSVHAANSVEAFFRLSQLGLCFYSLATSLRLIVSGRLIVKNCNLCIAKSRLPQRFVDYFRLSVAEYCYSQGCPHCSNSRIGVYEFLPVSREIKKYLSSSPLISVDELNELATSQGYRPYAQQVLDYLTQGVISFESACKSLGMAKCMFDS